MMCDPCFMDANQVGYVHELTLRRREEAPRRRDLDQAAAADDGAVLGRRADDLADLPRVGRLRAQGRLLQRAGGDQRHPLRAGAGLRASRRTTAGLRIAYLQFDGIGDEANAHRKVGNLFDVKLRAIENLHAAGIDVVPGRHHRQHGQQRSGRADHPVRDRELRQDQLRLVPAGVVHRPRRGHLGRRRRAARSATRCRTSRTT